MNKCLDNSMIQVGDANGGTMLFSLILFIRGHLIISMKIARAFFLELHENNSSLLSVISLEVLDE